MEINTTSRPRERNAFAPFRIYHCAAIREQFLFQCTKPKHGGVKDVVNKDKKPLVEYYVIVTDNETCENTHFHDKY